MVYLCIECFAADEEVDEETGCNRSQLPLSETRDTMLA